MKRINNIFNRYLATAFATITLLTACSDDFLTIYPRTDLAAGAPATEEVIKQNLTGVYQILLFDNYANGNNTGIPYFSDFRSDDLYKGGGDATDQPAFSYLAQFQSSAVDVPTGWWSIYYTGLKRCNGTLEACDNAVNVDASVVARLRAEALALRAYYVYLLWIAWGNIPYYDKAWTEEPFLAPQLSFDEVYPKIIADLDTVINTPELPMAVSGAETGRVNKAMVMMTKARTVMFKNDQSKYQEVLNDMNTIINSGLYELIKKSPDTKVTTNPVDWIFMREGENCKESIFETQNIPEGKTWGGSWQGFGNYTPTVISPRDIKDPAGLFSSGWGWSPVQEGAYAIFNEAGDLRKDASVNYWAPGTYSAGYQNTGLFLRKYAARIGYNQNTTGDAALNFENNLRIYRLAEAYLNAAEVAFQTSGQSAAQPYLDAIRDRAFGDDSHRIPATLNNIKLERHRELFGEGQRFWDLVRWGSDENGRSIEQVLSVNDSDHNLVRTYDSNKRFLPIPKDELDKTKDTEFELKQNPGWE
jgi:hypothetical protein